MSERVIFCVFTDRDQLVVSVQNRIFYEEDGSTAGELAEALNSREEELERLKSELELTKRDAQGFKTCWDQACNDIADRDEQNAALAAEVERLKMALTPRYSNHKLMMSCSKCSRPFLAALTPKEPTQ